jgi:hypothetical protein
VADAMLRDVHPAMFVLLGYPGTGKYTVAKQLVRALEERGETARLLDNHRSANVLFDLIIEAAGRSQLPAGIFPRVRMINTAILETVEHLSPPEWSFVFTYFVPAGSDTAHVDDVARVAAARNATYLPVVLTCDPGELARRVPRTDRAERQKLTDPARVPGMLAEGMYEPQGAFRLDVTTTTPDVAALAILEHLEGLA